MKLSKHRWDLIVPQSHHMVLYVRGRMLLTLCTSVNCSKCVSSVTNGVHFTFSSANSGTFSQVTGIKKYSHMISLTDICCHFLKLTELKVKCPAMLYIHCCFYFTYIHTSSSERSVLSAIFTSGIATKISGFIFMDLFSSSFFVCCQSCSDFSVFCCDLTECSL